VRAGVGREAAHEAIKEHAVAVALEMRHGRTDNDLFDRLAADPRLKLSRADIAALVADPAAFTGAATNQVNAVLARIQPLLETHPEAAAYNPPPIL
jgi:adenylosuccinate lyase